MSTATISGTLDLGGATRTLTIADSPSVNLDLDISGVIQNGGLTKSGAGKMQFSGTASNTYVDVTTVSSGALELNKSGGAVAVSTSLNIFGTVRETLGNQIADTSLVIVRSGATFDLNNQQEAIGQLNVMAGSVTIGTGTLTTGTVQF